ncbi:MCM2/3/5 family-domain-containing protein [Haematococcus lacustris]
MENLRGVDDFAQRLVEVIRRRAQAELEAIVSSTLEPNSHFSLPLSFLELAQDDPGLALALLQSPTPWFSTAEDTLLFSNVLLDMQQQSIASLMQRHRAATAQAAACGLPTPLQPYLTPKQLVHLRVHGLPSSTDPDPSCMHPSVGTLGCSHTNRLVTVSGTVVRSGTTKACKSMQGFQCTRCKRTVMSRCKLEDGGVAPAPQQCPGAPGQPCSGCKFRLQEEVTCFTGFQEIKVQEQVQSYGAGAQPCALTVVLQDELVDRVAPGDDVQVSGVVTLRWRPLVPGQRCEVSLVLLAHTIQVMAKKQGGLVRSPIHTAEAFQEFWAAHTTHPITARNKIVAAVCPQLHGLFLAKLALLLALVGGVARPESKLRGDAHLLMVGDPGVGKSQLMKFAARVAGRAVTASGKGSSSAGLTASAVKDDGVWVLEAGALVLADGGVCCIDEFDGIREADRATIHEAMEQQTVHIAKAGMMTKLSTRTTIIAAVNPRPGWRPHQPLTDACTLSGPLLSRFDMVLLLLDKAHPAWDMQVAACVLDNHVQGGQEAQQRSRQLLPAPHPPAGAGWTGQLPGSQAAPQALQGQGAAQGSSSSGGGGWNLDSLRDYLVWVKTTFQPCMSMEAHEVLQAYYVALRGMEERSAARTSLRALESLVRIAQAHARLCARNTVALQDSVMAVLVVEATAGCLHVVPADHTLFSDFHPEPDTEYVQLEQQVLAALGLVHLRKPLQALTGPASPTSPIFLKVRPTSAPWSAASSKATLAYVALGATGASQDPPRSGAGFGGTQETCPQPRAHHHHQLPDHPHLSQPIKLGG